MLPNPLLRKLVQISEEALPLVHVPLILGNDFFILTQQDVRKIEDTRLFNISKVMPNGDIKTIHTENASAWLQQHINQDNLLNNQNINSFLEHLISKINFPEKCQQQQTFPQSLQQVCNFNRIAYPEPMETSTTMTSIEQQRQWNKCNNTFTTPFPMHYSHGTSTTEINNKHEDKQNMPACCQCSHCKTCPQCGNRIEFCNKSINTQELHKDVDKSTNTEEELQNDCDKGINTQDLEKKSNEILDPREQLKKKKTSSSNT